MGLFIKKSDNFNLSEGTPNEGSGVKSELSQKVSLENLGSNSIF